MKKAYSHLFGSALAETAIVMSFTMLLLFGAMQIALIGFFQTQLDGATFLFSRYYAAGSTNDAALNTALSPIFPSVPMNMSPAFADPLTTTQPVNFTQWGSTTQRYGGASIIRDRLVQTSSSMNVTGFSVLGSNFTLSSGNVEGEQMVGNHDDDAQGAGYNSGTVYGSLVNPLTQDDQNVPPYYFNLAFIWYCPTFQFGTTCNGSELRSLGLAEYLKNDNYNTTADGIGTNGTFQTMACHQRIFADLAAAFPATMPSPSPVQGSDWDETSNGPATVPAFNGASFQMVYDWDVMPIHGESSGVVGTQYPLDPTYGCSSTGPGA